MCIEPIPDEHEHVVNTESRSLMCTCRGCWLLFTSNGAGGGKYRAVPDRYLALDGLSFAPGSWDELQIPVSVAFFFHNSSLGRVAAFYPSPAGATESLLELEAWASLVAANPVLASLTPDVEALLVRVDDTGPRGFLVPIDACYEFVGRLRMLWRGFDGGYEVRDFVDEFFERIRARSKVASA